jgi:hypothetical protein
LSRKDETVDKIISSTFPGFNGKRVLAHIAATVTFYGTMWDSGERRTYRLFDLKTGKVAPIPQEQFLSRSDAHHTPFALPPGVVAVVNCEGRVPGIEIISSADNITPMLPKPVDLSDDEKIVLEVTCSLKSSYGGIKDFRFSRSGLPRDRYDAAKASLIARKFLNKAGAATIEGRNARPDRR